MGLTEIQTIKTCLKTARLRWLDRRKGRKKTERDRGKRAFVGLVFGLRLENWRPEI